MAKTQSPDTIEKSKQIFFVLASIIIFASFLVFTPKVGTMLFSFKRQVIYNNFIQQVKKENTINPQAYWEFREFYSPGYFTLAKNGLTTSIVDTTEKNIGVKIKANSLQVPFAIFHSAKLESLDALSSKVNLSEIATDVIPKNIIFRDSDSLIYRDGSKTVKIIFIKPQSEMKKAVGFFENNDTDEKITHGKYWLNITTVQLD